MKLLAVTLVAPDELGVAGVGAGVEVGVGVGDAATTLKLIVTAVPLVPVAPVALNGVTESVCVPVAVYVQV